MSNKNLNLGNIVNKYLVKPVVGLSAVAIMSYSLTSCNNNKTIVDNSIHSSNISYIIGNSADSVSGVSIEGSNTGIIVEDHVPASYYFEGDSVNNLITSTDSTSIKGSGVHISASNTGIHVIRYDDAKKINK